MDGGPIELPGEAYPLNNATLYQTLVSATSRDPQQIQTGTKQLETWDAHEGFHALLQDVFIEKSLANDLRLLALIHLKNGVDKHWRKNSKYSMTDNEKSKIRSRLLASLLDEQNPQLARINAVLISRVARSDFPSQWPTLITDISQELRLAAQASIGRLDVALEVALHVVKELSTIRIGTSKTAFQSSANELLHVLDTLSAEKIQPWLHAMRAKAGSTEDIVPMMALTAKILKVQRRLAISGCQTPHREAVIQRQWQASAKLFATFIELFAQTSLDNACRALLARHILHFIKFHLDMAKTHPTSFGLLPGTHTLVLKYWTHAKTMRQYQQKFPGANENDLYFYEKFNLHTLLLLRACLKIAYSPHHAFNMRQKPNQEEVKQVKTSIRDEWLTDAFITDVFENLLSKFFVCVQNDLEEWAADAEEWEMKEEGTEDAIELSVRPCAERLFLDMVINRKALVQGQLHDVARLVSETSDPLIKDAAYSALGCAAAAISSIVDFDDFLDKYVINDLKTESQNQNVIRRRIAILVAQWIRVKISNDKLSLVYQIYDHLLDPSVAANDQAVRITAGKRLVDVIQVWNFDSEAFAPHAASILGHLAGLISEVNLVETKLALLGTLKEVIQRMELQAGPLADQIVALLPPLWEESGTEYALKTSVVGILVKLVESLKADSAPLHPLVIPIIKEALEPNSEAATYLLEDALDLMAQVVIQSQEPSPQLLSLIPLLMPVLEWDNELLDTATKVSESLVLLAPAPIFATESLRVELLRQLTGLLNAKKRRIRDPAGDVVELIIRAAEALNSEEGVKVVVSDLMSIGLLPKAISSITESAKNRAASNSANSIQHSDSDNFTNYFVILARIIICNPSIFVSVVESWCANSGANVENVLASILDEWLTYMDQVTMPARSKLMCIAFADSFGTGQSWILSKLEGLMSIWSSVVLELRENEEDHEGDSLVYDRPTNGATHGEPPEALRRKNVLYSDPVHTVKLCDCIKKNFYNAVSMSGGEEAFQERWLTNMVDQGTWNMFRKYQIV